MCISMSLFAFHAPAARAAAPATQNSGVLPGGGTYVMRRDDLATTTAMELWFRAPASGYDARYPGISRLAITALAASHPAHGSSLSELVNSLGGTLSINVYPDIAMVGVSVPSWDAPRVLRALTSTYFTASLSNDGFKAALRDCAVAAAESRFDAERILQDTLFAQLFAAGPARYPPIPAAAADFTKIPQDAVKTFAARAFRESNAVLSLAGDLNAQLLSNVQRGSGGAPMDAPLDSTLAATPGSTTKNAYVPGLGFAWAGPPIADAKAATALDFVADYLFDPDHGTLAQAIQKKNADAYVNGQFITLHNPGVLLLTISGTSSQALRQQVLAAITAMQQPMNAKAFRDARTAFEYHLFSQTQTPLSRADNFGWYAIEGNAAYAPGGPSGDYVKAVQSLDPGYVAQIVRTYLQHPAIVQLLTSDQKGTTT
jgi:predicted Zn-dependent peptidase